MKKSLIIGAIVLLISGICFLNYTKSDSELDNISPAEKIVISADYPKYDALDNLVDRADTIILGKIVNMRYEELNVAEEHEINDELNNLGGELDKTKDVYTVYDIEILEEYKGLTTVSDIIKVKQLGGIIDNIEYVLEEYDSDLQTQKEYILFLETYENLPASLLNPIQASYEVEINKKARTIDSQYLIKSNPDNEINFTMSDLINSDNLQ